MHMDAVYAIFGFPNIVTSTFISVKYFAVYHYSRACVLTCFLGAQDHPKSRANFVLPEISKLESEAKSGSLAIILLSHGTFYTWNIIWAKYCTKYLNNVLCCCKFFLQLELKDLSVIWPNLLWT